MKTIIGAAMAAAALGTGVAAAEEGSPFTGNVALTTDYTFRGISQTQEGPAIQGGFDYAQGPFFAGVWASNVDFGLEDGSLEIDVYGGVTHEYANGLSLSAGVIGYLYPNASDDGAELDYVEGFVTAGFSLTEQLEVGAGVYVSPEFTGDTGTGVYWEANAAFAALEWLSLSGAVGQQSTEETLIGGEDEYLTWNLGGTVSAYGFDFDLRYVDTDLDDVEAADSRVVFAISREF